MPIKKMYRALPFPIVEIEAVCTSSRLDKACVFQLGRNDWSQQYGVDPLFTRRTRNLPLNPSLKVSPSIEVSNHHSHSHQHHDESQRQRLHPYAGSHLLECTGWHLHRHCIPRKRRLRRVHQHISSRVVRMGAFTLVSIYLRLAEKLNLILTQI